MATVGARVVAGKVGAAGTVARAEAMVATVAAEMAGSQPVLQQTPACSSVAVQRRLPCAAHSCTASNSVLALPSTTVKIPRELALHADPAHELATM
eukprot:7384471-Prymnesium_polylepis.4